MSVEDAASFPSVSFQGSPYAATINNRHYIQTKQLLSSYFIVVLIKIGINFYCLFHHRAGKVECLYYWQNVYVQPF